MLRRSCGLVAAVLLVLVATACDQDGGTARRPPTGTPGSSTMPPAQRAAVHVVGDPRVGALFLPHAYPTLHTCSAGVLSSTSRNVILTAAHCLTGTGRGYRFAPRYDEGIGPEGLWRVTAAYGAPAWLRARDPRADWAVLTVAPRRVAGSTRRLQDVTGSSRLGATARAHDRVTVTGYALGAGDQPLRCATTVYRHRGYPAFDCDGFPAGTSGSPWLAATADGPVLRGLIGGLHQGGCTPATSYSPLLGRAVRRALARAERGAPPDRFPTRGSDHCG